jgi:hypothetical protein
MTANQSSGTELCFRNSLQIYKGRKQKHFITIYLYDKPAKNLKTICACTESTDLISLALEKKSSVDSLKLSSICLGKTRVIFNNYCPFVKMLSVSAEGLEVFLDPGFIHGCPVQTYSIKNK